MPAYFARNKNWLLTAGLALVCLYLWHAQSNTAKQAELYFDRIIKLHILQNTWNERHANINNTFSIAKQNADPEALYELSKKYIDESHVLFKQLRTIREALPADHQRALRTMEKLLDGHYNQVVSALRQSSVDIHAAYTGMKATQALHAKANQGFKQVLSALMTDREMLTIRLRHIERALLLGLLFLLLGAIAIPMTAQKPKP